MQQNDRTKLPLMHFVWPILFENLLRISLTSVDILMLSAYSPKAVAAVGLVQQFAFFIQILYLMVTIGASVLIAQSLGAGLRREAGLAGVGSVVLALGLALLLSGLTVALAEPILCLYRLEAEVHGFARQFLVIYGGGSVFMAINMAQGSILRAWGYPRDPMVVNIAANLINGLGGALCLFGWFGLPVLGVPGVACATVFSQLGACLILGQRLKRRREVDLPLREIGRVPSATYRGILAVGIPTAGENLSYNIGQILIMNLIARMGTASMSAYVYAITLLRFVFIPALSIGMGAQIKVGYFAGAGLQDEAYPRVLRYALVGFGISLGLVCLLVLARPVLLPFFTHDPQVLGLLGSILLVSLVHEPGRSLDLIIIPELKGAGDVRFPVAVGVLFLWGVGVGLSYGLGLSLGLGILGVWIALALDEWVRGLIMLARWRSGAWKTKALIRRPPPPNLLAPEEEKHGPD